MMGVNVENDVYNKINKINPNNGGDLNGGHTIEITF
jgi:hypothetical protein